jgi:Fe/S biogenesis protein NfuA
MISAILDPIEIPHRSERPAAPLIITTDNAKRHIRDKMARMTLPVKGIRVYASRRSALRLDYAIRFVPAEEPANPSDTILSFDEINVFIDEKSAPHLHGATIDFIFRIIGSELKVLVSFEHIDSPEGRLATKIQRVIDEQINPGLSTHGGAAALVDIEGDVIFIELSGGCQGCSMADSTMKQGIETTILQNVPEVREIRDVTDHAKGTNPYFQ